jgi:hypothetical protein
MGLRYEILNVRQSVMNSSEDRTERSIRSLVFLSHNSFRCFFSQQLFADFSHNSCSQIFLTTAVRRFFSQRLLADFSHNSCSLIFLTTAVRRFFSQQLLADFSHNSCSQIFLTTAVRWLFLTTAVR